MNSSGKMAEIIFSKHFHHSGTAVLISDQVLRIRSAGQVDLAKYEAFTKEITLVEMKSSERGLHCLSRSQQMRLRRSQEFISQIFGLRVKMQLQKLE